MDFRTGWSNSENSKFDKNTTGILNTKANILVICGQNKRRSRTAEFLYKNDDRFNIRSAGLSPRSDRQLKAKDLDWADLVLVMEDSHSSRIKKDYRNLDLPPIEVLHIDDEYDYLQPELIDLLKDRIEVIVSDL
jgi:protein-tyrosine phosphatase